MRPTSSLLLALALIANPLSCADKLGEKEDQPGLEPHRPAFIDLSHSQPHPQPDNPMDIERTTAFGDVILPLVIAPSKELAGNWLLGLGPTWIFPTGVSRWTTSGKWQVGPAAVLGYLSEKWILGAFFQNWTSFGGSGPSATNSMNLQPIAAYFSPMAGVSDTPATFSRTGKPVRRTLTRSPSACRSPRSSSLALSPP